MQSLRYAKRRRPLTAFALTYVLLITAITVLLMGGLLSLVRQTLMLSTTELSKDRAAYACQAGLAAAVSQLETTTSWTTGFPSPQTVPQGTATYSMQFLSPGSTPGPFDSINNLNSNLYADCYLGPGTVPPYCAFLVIQGQDSSSQKTLEALVGGGSSIFSNVALGATSSVSMIGNSTVWGIDSLLNSTLVPAGIHSNQATGSSIISWSPGSNPSAVFRVSGTLSCCSSAAGAINPAYSANAAGGVETGHPPLQFPKLDIAGIVASHNTLPPSTLATGGGYVLATAPQAYYPGDQNVVGDLILANSRLYIDGNLNVTGSIFGYGLIAVNGTTTFRGNSQTFSVDSSYTTLLSKGNVLMQGFDGNAYMNGLAASNPAINNSWSVTTQALTNITNLLNACWPNTETILPGDTVIADTRIDQNQFLLSHWWPGYSGGPPGPPPYPDGTPDPGGNAGLLASMLPSANPSGQFMIAKLQSIDNLFRVLFDSSQSTTQLWGSVPPGYITSVLGAYAAGTYADPLPNLNPYYSSLAGSNFGGIFDMLESGTGGTPPYLPLFQKIRNVVAQMSQYGPGSANFLGVVYSNGAIVSSNDLTIIGCLIADDNGSQSPATLTDSFGNSYSVNPGQVVFGDGCNLVYVKDMVSGGLTYMVGAGEIQPLNWRLR